MEKFLIPSYYSGQIFTHGELIKPKGGVLADAEKASNDMSGMVKLVSGCLASVTDSNGNEVKNDIEGVVRNMSFQTVEYLATKILANRTDGAIEQIVVCPRCKEKYIYEYINQDIDERIYFEELEAVCYEESEEPMIHIDLEEPIEIKTRKGDVLDMVSSITFRFPTMNDGISASVKYGNDPTRRQYGMYISAMTHINGTEIDSSYKTTWGMFLFNRMDADDIKKIADELKKYGLMKVKKHECSECGKIFDFIVDTTNFFG